PAPRHSLEQRLSRTIPVPPCSPAAHLAHWHTAAQGCTAPAQHLGQRLAPTTVVPSYNPVAHPALRRTSAQVGSAPTRYPVRQISRTIPAPSHSPAARPAARCHTAVQVGSVPTHCPGHPASSVVADRRLRSCLLGKQPCAQGPVPSVAAWIQADPSASVLLLFAAHSSEVSPFHSAEPVCWTYHPAQQR